MKNLKDCIKAYTNTAQGNDLLYDYFTKQTDIYPILKDHRDFIKNNKLGFGERAFHAMWKMILEQLIQDFNPPKILEIGVYKGQVISLWALLAKYFDTKIEITAITPLAGNPVPKNKFLVYFLSKTSKHFKKNIESGNFYEKEDYHAIIESTFKKFDLDINTVKFIKGYSNEKEVLDKVRNLKFDAIYIDGDHTFEGVTNDILNYHSLLEIKGLLIMDDSSCNIPGTTFWKGHQSVSDACEIIEPLGFINILNVGHNRVFQKV